MKNIAIIFCINVLFGMNHQSVAQDKVKEAASFLGTLTISNAYVNVLNSHFRSCQVYRLDSRAIKEIVGTKTDENSFRLRLGEDHSWDLMVRRTPISTSNTAITLSTERGEEQISLMSPLRLKGVLSNNVRNSEIRLTVDDDFIYGFIRDGDSIYFIQPLRQFIKGSPHNEFVVYEKNQAYIPTGAMCGVTNSEWKPTRSGKIEQKYKTITRQELNYYVAVDYSMYEAFDFSVRDIIHTIEGIINLVESNFDDEFNDPFSVLLIVPNSFYISTCPTCDPWTASANAEDLIHSFRDWGNQNSTCTDRGRLSQLWTFRDIFGLNNGVPNFGVIGIAYTGENVCTGDGYQVLEFFTGNADLLRNLVTHETGHNFNSPHDYEIGATCNPLLPPYLMAPIINGSNTWSHGAFKACDRNSTAIINDYYPNVDCLTLSYGWPLPSGDRWVDFLNTNCFQNGTQQKPFNSLILGVNLVGKNKSIFIKPGVTEEKTIISWPCRLERDGNSGTVVIGER